MDGVVPSFFRQSEQKKYPLDIVFLRNITETARNAANIAVPLATLIAFSRLYLFVHFPTDILASVIFGIAIGLTV